MQIIKDKQLTNNDWSFVGDDSETGNNGDITVSLDRWIDQQQQLLNHAGKVGIRIKPDDRIEKLAGNLEGIELIELDFPGFGDGRPFSQARLLRNRLGYRGEIRAIGHYLPDQVYYLHRVGVNAFQFENPNQIPLALSCLDDFSVTYQN